MKKLKIPFKNKKAFKKRSKQCRICGEKEYSLLDAHRIVPGEEGGKYEESNCVCLCVSCHRKVHSDLIKILGWKHSTCGRLLHIINEDKQEEFI
jgi:5-methylcytosine-specific restriction endonuclease McrA